MRDLGKISGGIDILIHSSRNIVPVLLLYDSWLYQCIHLVFVKWWVPHRFWKWYRCFDVYRVRIPQVEDGIWDEILDFLSMPKFHVAGKEWAQEIPYWKYWAARKRPSLTEGLFLFP